MQVFVCFLNRETRLAILKISIDVVCSLDQQSKGMKYVEIVAKRFGLLDNLWEVTQLNNERVDTILRNMNSDNFCLCRAIIEYLLTIDNRFVGFSKVSGMNKRLMDINKDFNYMSAEYSDPLDDNRQDAWIFNIYLVNN